MRKIWIFNQYAMTPYNGTLTRHYYFTKYLIDAGYDVIIFTDSTIHNSEHSEIVSGLYTEKHVDGVRFVYVKSAHYQDNGVARIRNMLAFCINLFKTIRDFPKPDVIYASSPQILSLYAGIRASRRLKVPCISEVRDLWPESIVEYSGASRKNPVIQALYLLEKYIYERSNAIIFTMEGMYDYIRSKPWAKSVPEEKCFYINNGVDLKEFDENAKSVVLDDEQLNDETTFKVVYCGSVRKANNIDLLVDCAKEIQARPNNESIRFFIYGEGPKREQLEQRCKDEGISNIYFKGFVEKKYIACILSKSNLNILNYQQASTQKYGNSSNKLFEYLAAGHPVLANIDEGKYPIISKYGCGIVLKDLSVKAYSDVIESFARMDAETYQRYCENALRTVQLFDTPALVAKLIKVFDFCISGDLNRKGTLQ